MDLDTPCRDTENMENSSNDVNNTPLAFTISFGDSDDLDDKIKKFERFAQRSSLRQLKSPRQDKDNSDTSQVNVKEDNVNDGRSKELHREKSKLSRTNFTSHKYEKNNAKSLSVSDIERLNIGEKMNNLIEDNRDEVLSQAGTYTMEEELDQVQKFQLST